VRFFFDMTRLWRKEKFSSRFFIMVSIAEALICPLVREQEGGSLPIGTRCCSRVPSSRVFRPRCDLGTEGGTLRRP
jgi:hypothetical protein